MYRVAAWVFAVACVVILSASPSVAATPAPLPVVGCDSTVAVCQTKVVAPGQPGSGKPVGVAPRPVGCSWLGTVEPCYEADFGWFDPAVGCYFEPANPVPTPTDPSWEGHYPNGAVYQFTCLGIHGTGGGTGWLPNPPPGSPQVTPAQLARQALATLRLPSPSIARSPTQANSDHGVPYTWVNLWTWFWTAPGTWHPLTARAAVGGVWAAVTVTPTAFVVDPGDGSASVSCAGPGRPWVSADGDGAPTGGGCGYQYTRVTTSGPLTAATSIDWSVSWVGSGGAGGVLPALTTTARSAFAVEQLQVVNR